MSGEGTAARALADAPVYAPPLSIAVADSFRARFGALVQDASAATASGDVDAAAAALRRLAGDPAERARLGASSREIVRGWGYEPSVESFVAAVREAAASP